MQVEWKRIGKKNTSLSIKHRYVNSKMLNNSWITYIKEGLRKYFEPNEYENTTYQNLWNTTKQVCQGKFTLLNTYVRIWGKKGLTNQWKNVTVQIIAPHTWTMNFEQRYRGNRMD